MAANVTRSTTLRVPFVDLRAEHESIRDSLERAMSDVLERSQFILGEQLARFEQQFAEYVGTRYCIGVSSGTEALKLALEALGVGPGDEVILPTNTFAATALAACALGATPRLVDVCEETALLDVEQTLGAAGPRTKAIVPVHLFGRLVDCAPLLDCGVPLIEDAAQAHGARYLDQSAGAQGAAGCFSFYPTKNLGALGDGGAVVTSDPQLYERIRQLRNYGQQEKYVHETIGYNARLDEIQAAVLLVKLRLLDSRNEVRRRIAQFYDQNLRVATPPLVPGDVCHLYVIRVANRDALRERLAEMGVETGLHYPLPLHLQPCFAELGHARGSFPVAERLAEQSLSLPMYPGLSRDQQELVVELVNRWAEPL